MRSRFVFGLALGAVVIAGAANAGNDDEILVGNRASMLGGPVAATVNDASATWYNPAGLGGDSSHQIDVSATAYSLRAYTVPRFISRTGGASKDGAVTEFVSVPTQIAYVRKVSSTWSLGLGYFAPHVTNYVLREGLGEESPRLSQCTSSGFTSEAGCSSERAVALSARRAARRTALRTSCGGCGSA
jgi:hypothetical protein